MWKEVCMTALLVSAAQKQDLGSVGSVPAPHPGELWVWWWQPQQGQGQCLQGQVAAVTCGGNSPYPAIPLLCCLPLLSSVHPAASPAGHYTALAPSARWACGCPRLHLGVSAAGQTNPRPCTALSLQCEAVLSPCTRCPCYMCFSKHSTAPILLPLLHSMHSSHVWPQPFGHFPLESTTWVQVLVQEDAGANWGCPCWKCLQHCVSRPGLQGPAVTPQTGTVTKNHHAPELHCSISGLSHVISHRGLWWMLATKLDPEGSLQDFDLRKLWVRQTKGLKILCQVV